MRLPILLLASLLAASSAQAQTLKIAQAGPEGELSTLAQGNEVRVVFSEPMVALGRIPERVEAPFFRIRPALPGTFRWSGTDTLLFTPRPGEVPYATRYEVTIDASARSVAGHTLPEPFTFTFATPTLGLDSAHWRRKGERYDSPLLVYLRFNQPVDAATLLPHLRLRYESHPFTPPFPPQDVLEHMREADPQAEMDLEAKAQRTMADAARIDAVPASPARDWDKKAYPAAPNLVVLETDGVPPPETWIKVVVDEKAKGRQGDLPAGKALEETLKLEPAFFVDGFRCRAACDPDDYNPIHLRGRASRQALRKASQATDVTNPAKPVVLKREGPPASGENAEEGGEEAEDEDVYDRSQSITLDELGYRLLPARRYSLRLAKTLAAEDGQTLGYTWVDEVENWHQGAFTSFGTGHGVWETSGGPLLPFYARNLRSVTQWLSPVTPEQLMPTVRELQGKYFSVAPDAPGTPRTLSPTPDRIQSFGLDLKPILSAQGTGIGWAALQDGRPIARSHQPKEVKPRSTLVQVTNLGISVKDSPQGTLVMVTRLDDAAPVEGARVSIRDLQNAVVWSGVTDAQGLAMAPDTRLRDPERSWEFRFLVTAEKDGDVAYVGSDWGDGVEPWAFGLRLDLGESSALLRGAVFADRGVYKLGEEVHLKAILRSDAGRGIALLPEGTEVAVVVKDSHGEEVDNRIVKVGAWSSADWTMTLPAEAPLGRWSVQLGATAQQGTVTGDFLVAAYRRPDFRVDVTLAGESSVAGVGLKGVVEGRYLFGASMAGRDVRWTYTRSELYTLPRTIEEAFPLERWVFLDEQREEHGLDTQTVKTATEPLDEQGRRVLDLETDLKAGRPLTYALEGEVTDLSRQTIAGRASFRVDPAPWYVGLKRPPFFATLDTGVDTEVLASDLAGKAAAGVPVTVTLTQVQWHAVRRSEGQSYYTWETERKEVPAGSWDVTTAATPQPLHVPLPRGGYFILRATAADAAGHQTTSATAFYVLGPGYTAWERYDHPRIDLVPEKKTYRPGETARIMVKSPWEKATALHTTEREGIRTHRTFTLSSTQETVTVPLTEDDIPNVYVSVLLVKGRSGGYDPKDSSDPGKPAYRLGYTELKVEDAAKRLAVQVKTDREEYRPAARAHVEVSVKDAKGNVGPTEVTLWAVDYGVLSLTGYRTPDVLRSVWMEKALQVLTEDSRQNVISRRVTVEKGGDEGGGGGADEGPGTSVRKDFRVLAFWLGSLVTDARGIAVADVTLPESLTQYRVMAVAADKASRFGWAEREIRVSKPLLLKSAFPRFLAMGDTALFGSVVHSQVKDKGTAVVTMRSLDPAVLEVVGEAKKTTPLPAKGSAEVRFEVRARAVGRARIQMTVRMQDEQDAFEESIPVEILASPEVVAAYGQTAAEARESVVLPEGVIPTFGGLRVETASTAMVGLGEGARYLVDYPYGCAEQRSSAALALLLAADLGEAFRLPGIEPAKLKEKVDETFRELPAFQCDGGGFAFWKGQCRMVSPYLTSYVLHVLQRGKALGHPVDQAVLDGGYKYLESVLGQAPEGTDPYGLAWEAFAAKVLAEGGKNPDSHVTRLFGKLDKLPVFGLTYLLDAVNARGGPPQRSAELLRRVRNAILPEGGTAHVEELRDPDLLWLWSSNERSTALALGALVRQKDEDPLVPRLVRWLLQVRKDGRWGNTQENALAMEALVAYYRRYEAEVPDFHAVVRLGQDTLATQEFRGRSAVAQVKETPMKEVLGKGKAGEALPLVLAKEGTGTLHYMARLTYAADALHQDGLDKGFVVERSYAPKEGPADRTSYAAGELVAVTLTVRVPKERRFVAVTDPLPAGFEPVESWFATTASDLASEQRQAEEETQDWRWWDRGGFDNVERHDDRVLLFATRLSEGVHTFTYMVRATTAGTFRTAPTHAEEMYEPEVFGRTGTAVVTVK
jgi:uncharacterized protein YfaS (alpha-2-macroglobulin family)